MSAVYVTLQQFCDYHGCETVVVQEFIDFGIISVDQQEGGAVIPEPEIPRVERALRLHTDLGVNAAGIDVILHLLDRLEGERFLGVEDFG